MVVWVSELFQVDCSGCVCPLCTCVVGAVLAVDVFAEVGVGGVDDR